MAQFKNDAQGVSSFTVKTGIPRITPEKIFHSIWTIPLLIILAVFIFNLSYLFTDLLWHDDGFCYYKASEGKLPYGVAWRSKICTLAPYLDGFYSYGMVYLGLPLMRGIFVLVMALSSLFLYFLYRDSFGFDFRVSFLAAILPNILPSLRGIPVGLNTSYAMWGLLPIVICLLLLTQVFKKRGFYSWVMAGSAFIFYYVGLNIPGQPSSNFLIPCVLFFLVMFFPSHKLKSLLCLLPFSGLGAWQLYKQFLHSHKEPTAFPLEEIASRVRQFFEMSDFLAFNSSFSIYLTLGLILLGVTGLLATNSNLFKQPDHFGYRTGIFRVLLLGWPLCWMASNSLAYVAASPTFRPYDYAYIFNFGSVLLQALGIIYLFIVVLSMFGISKHSNAIAVSLIVLIIFAAGLQRIYYRYSDWGWKVRAERSNELVRKTLSGIDIPPQAQIIIFGAESAHPGTYIVNSGDLRYIMKRNDISGVIGSDIYPNDIYAGGNDWSNQMRDFDKNKPILAFRNNGGILDHIELMLQVVSTENKELPRLEWNLFDIRKSDNIPQLLASGKGISSYTDFIKNDLPPDLRGADIAFAPGNHPDTFIDPMLTDLTDECQGVLPSEISFDSQFTIQNVFIKNEKEDTYLQIQLKVDELPSEKFRLGYTLDGVTGYVSIWDFVLAGDRILVNTPPVDRVKLEQGIRIGLINATGWPYRKLSISNTMGRGENSFVVKWTSAEEVE